MSKRRIEDDIDELSEEYLEDLSNEKRVRLIMKGAARDEKWIDKVVEATPRKGYVQYDVGFTRRTEVVYQVAQSITTALNETFLNCCWAHMLHNSLTKFPLLYEDSSPGTEMIENVLHPSTFLARLYIQQAAYRRFAEDDLDLTLTELVSKVPRGKTIVEQVDDILEKEQSRIQLLYKQSEHSLVPGINLPEDIDAEIEQIYTDISVVYDKAISD